MDTQLIFRSNRESTHRMQQLILGLSEEQLSRPIDNGWSIAQTLAHLAFWDQRAIHVIETARKDNIVHVPQFDDQLNDILAPILAVIPPAAAARMALKIADTLDGLLEDCPPQLIDQLVAVNSRLVERSLHRNDHLSQMESVLKDWKSR